MSARRLLLLFALVAAMVALPIPANAVWVTVNFEQTTPGWG